MNGALIINKPQGLTSHDVVARVRRITGERSVGHIGTLDPMATGVLPLLLGKFTRLAQFYLGADKAYRGTIQFGQATDTYDAEGEPVGHGQILKCHLKEIREASARYVGEIEQVPPPFSAKKIKGVPAYKLARKDMPVELKSVKVSVSRFELLAFDESTGVAEFEAEVGSGTYLRSLAHDLGQALGCGAHLASLERTRVGSFAIDGTVPLERLAEAAQAGQLEELLLSPLKLLPEIPSIRADDDQMSRIRHGNSVNLPEFSRAPQVKVFHGQGDLVCIATRVAGTLFQPKIVMVE